MKRTRNTYLALIAVLLTPMAANADIIVLDGVVPANGLDYIQFEHGGGAASFNIFARGFQGSGLDSMLTLAVDDGSPIGALTGLIIGQNDDSNATGWDSDGSTSTFDSFLSFANLAAGNYILGVGAWFTTEQEFRTGVATTPNEPGNYRLTMSIQSVPEPGTLALLGIGLLGLGAARRRKKA